MIDESFPISGKVNLRCRFSRGSLVVRAHDHLAEARVAISPRNGDDRVLEYFRVQQSGSTIEIREERERGGTFLENLLGRGNQDGVDVVVDVPSGADVEVMVQSADITIEGRVGTSNIGSGSSQVELDEVDGDLRVRGGSGDVSVRRVSGSGNLRGGSGKVRIGEVGKNINIGLGSGDLAIDAAHGSVRMRSGSGGTVIGLAEADVDVVSGSGAVTIGLRPGQPARLDVLTGSGRLHTEMPVEDRAPSARTARPITVRARTGAGDVTIRRAEPVG